MQSKGLKMSVLLFLVLPKLAFCQTEAEERYTGVYYFRKELLPWEEEMIREMAPKALKQILSEDEEGEYQWLKGATIGRAVPIAEAWGIRELGTYMYESLKGTKWERVYLSCRGYLVELRKGGRQVAAMELMGTFGTEIHDSIRIWEDEARRIALPYARERNAKVGDIWLEGRLWIELVGWHGAGSPPGVDLGWLWWAVGLIRGGHLIGLVRVEASDGRVEVMDFPVPCRLGSRLTKEQLVKAATIYGMTWPWAEEFWLKHPDIYFDRVSYDPPPVQNFFPVEPVPGQLTDFCGIVFFKSDISVTDPSSLYGSVMGIEVSMFGELRKITMIDPLDVLSIFCLPIGQDSSRSEEGKQTKSNRVKGKEENSQTLFPFLFLAGLFPPLLLGTLALRARVRGLNKFS